METYRSKFPRFQRALLNELTPEEVNQAVIQDDQGKQIIRVAVAEEIIIPLFPDEMLPEEGLSQDLLLDLNSRRSEGEEKYTEYEIKEVPFEEVMAICTENRDFIRVPLEGIDTKSSPVEFEMNLVVDKGSGRIFTVD